MTPNVVNSLEQFRLGTRQSPHVLTRYGAADSDKLYPGTREISERMGFKHPVCADGGEEVDWEMTTDFVVVLREPVAGSYSVLAIAIKPDAKALTRRQKQLMAIEHAYWRARGLEWLLITPTEFDKQVASTLQRTAAWALVDAVSDECRHCAVEIAHRLATYSLTTVLEALAPPVGSMDMASVPSGRRSGGASCRSTCVEAGALISRCVT